MFSFHFYGDNVTVKTPVGKLWTLVGVTLYYRYNGGLGLLLFGVFYRNSVEVVPFTSGTRTLGTFTLGVGRTRYNVTTSFTGLRVQGVDFHKGINFFSNFGLDKRTIDVPTQGVEKFGTHRVLVSCSGVLWNFVRHVTSVGVTIYVQETIIRGRGQLTIVGLRRLFVLVIFVPFFGSFQLALQGEDTR